MEIFIVWLICGAICAYIAGNKNRSKVAWFFLGLIFGIFALIAIALVSSKKEVPAPSHNEPTIIYAKPDDNVMNDVKGFAKNLKKFNPNKSAQEIIASNELIIKTHIKDLSPAARDDFMQVLEFFLTSED